MLSNYPMFRRLVMKFLYENLDPLDPLLCVNSVAPINLQIIASLISEKEAINQAASNMFYALTLFSFSYRLC